MIFAQLISRDRVETYSYVEKSDAQLSNCIDYSVYRV